MQRERLSPGFYLGSLRQSRQVKPKNSSVLTSSCQQLLSSPRGCLELKLPNNSLQFNIFDRRYQDNYQLISSSYTYWQLLLYNRLSATIYALHIQGILDNLPRNSARSAVSWFVFNYACTVRCSLNCLIPGNVDEQPLCNTYTHT